MKGLLIQEFKTLFKSPASLSILIIPIVLMIGLGYLLPSGWIIPSAITIGIVGTVLLYFGGSIEEIKRTSFMKSISLTRLNKFTFLATKILFSIFISMISVLWVLLFGWFFTEAIPFLAEDFSNLLPADSLGAMDIIRQIPFNVDWTKINWLMMLYSGSITIIVSISIAFVFVTFSKSSLSFYLMSFGYLLAMILFGGVIMPSFLISSDNSWFKNLYYLIPNFYTNNVMAQSFGNGLGSTVGNIVNFIDKIVDSDSIYLGILLEALDGTIDSVLSNTAMKDVINAFENMKQNNPGRIVEITDFISGKFFKGFGWNWGLISKLDNVDLIVWDDTNAYELFVYNVLKFPSTITQTGTDTFKSWYKFLNTIPGGADLLGGVVKNTIIAIMKDPSHILEIIIHENINIPLVGKYTIIELLNIPIVAKEMAIILNNATTGIGIFGGTPMTVWLQGLVTTIDGMFNTAGPVDYIVPWGEVAVLLGISTVFFKWS
ncbi:MAG: hypothetical protein HRS50_00455 [Mycoplasmataceae bacterium]|nr:hypothetical protein [Mycoplasmataceae bacterium]